MLHENIAREEAQLQKLARVGTPQAIQMLRQYAQTHQDDAIRLSLANQAVNDAKEMHSKALAMLSGQQPPTVAQQVVQSIGGQGGAPMPPPGGPQGPMPPQGMPAAPPPGMQMPPPMPPAPQGLAGLPAPNMQGMADGGIAGYADEDEAVGYADGGVAHMFGGGTPEEAAIRAQGRSLGLDDAKIDEFIARRKAQVPQTNLPYTPATTGAVAKDNMVVRDTTSMFRDPGYDVFKNPPTTRQLYGDQPTLGTAADAIEKMTRENAAKDLFARPGMQQFVADLGAGRVRPSAEEPGKILPMTPGQGALNVPTAEQVSAALAAQKAVPTRSLGSARTGAPAVPVAPVAPTPSAGIETLIPEKATEGTTPEAAMEKAGRFSLGSQYTEGQTLLNRAGERQDQYLRDIFMQRPSKEIGQKTEEYIKSQREELAAEKKDRSANFLISAGLAIASGTSRNAMQNIAQGLQVGVKDAKDAMKDFKAAQKELARMDADLENLRAAQKERDFDRVFSLEQRIADRDESRKQKMFDGAMTLAGQDRALAGNIYSLAEQNAEQWKRTKAEFGFRQGERRESQEFTKGENVAQREFQAKEGAANRANQKAIASMPSGQLQLLSILGGAKFGEAPTQAQLNAGFDAYNSANDPETAILAYEKLATERAKAMATNPGVELPPLPDRNTWLKEFTQQKRALSLLNRGMSGGQIPTTTTPGSSLLYGR